MSAADIFNYCVPFLEGLGPAVMVIAVIANGKELLDLLSSLFEMGNF